ncbi:MAG: polysaccharide biosynthesis/export family protein [Bacteroidota bacterium]
MKSFNLNSIHKLFVVALASSMIFSSCVNQKNVRILQEKAVKDVSAAFKHSQKPTYRLKTGDHLYIQVFSVDPKTAKFFQSDFPTYYGGDFLYLNSYPVDEDGYIHYSFIDKMFVRGLTVEEIKKQLQNTLNEYFSEVTVKVKLVNFEVAVLGEVNNPGNYTIDKEHINLFQALGLAGGISTFGNIEKVYLIRQTVDGSKVNYIDLSDNNILTTDYFYVMPNDIIYVEPRGAKSFAYEKLPYSTVFSVIALGISVYSIFGN